MIQHEEKPHVTDGQARAGAALLAARLGEGWTPLRRCGVGESCRKRRRFVKAWFARAERGDLTVRLAHGGGYFGHRRGGVDGPVVATPQEAAETAPAPAAARGGAVRNRRTSQAAPHPGPFRSISAG